MRGKEEDLFTGLGLSLCQCDTATASKLNDCKLLSFPPPGSDNTGRPKVLKVSRTFSGQSKIEENDIAKGTRVLKMRTKREWGVVVVQL